ncbi:MAG TPA: hypothetical protein VM925_09010 [Labilithrix sp.]|nr:hypothetical protein [Labilithrix sp.]
MPVLHDMLTDGLKSQSLEDKLKQMNVAELLEQSSVVDDKPAIVQTAPLHEPVEAVPAE